jgi:hypothetical protein
MLHFQSNMLPPTSDLKRSINIPPFSANLSDVQVLGGVSLADFVRFIVSRNFVIIIIIIIIIIMFMKD